MEIDDGSIDLDLTGLERRELHEVFGIVSNVVVKEEQRDGKKPIACPECGHVFEN